MVVVVVVVVVVVDENVDEDHITYLTFVLLAQGSNKACIIHFSLKTWIGQRWALQNRPCKNSDSFLCTTVEPLIWLPLADDVLQRIRFFTFRFPQTEEA